MNQLSENMNLGWLSCENSKALHVAPKRSDDVKRGYNRGYRKRVNASSYGQEYMSPNRQPKGTPIPGLLTDEIDRLKAMRAREVELLTELELHGGPHVPLTFIPGEREYISLRASELKAEKAHRKEVIAEIDAEIANKSAELLKKVNNAKSTERNLERARRQFICSPDFRSVTTDKGSHLLTPTQAAVIDVLYDLYLKGTPAVSDAFVLESDKVNAKSSRLRDIFRSNMEAFRDLIARPKPGIVKLNI